MNAEITLQEHQIEGPALVTAKGPTLLELYRSDPIGVRGRIERTARAERSADVNAACGGLFRSLERRVARLAVALKGYRAASA